MEVGEGTLTDKERGSGGERKSEGRFEKGREKKKGKEERER